MYKLTALVIMAIIGSVPTTVLAETQCTNGNEAVLGTWKLNLAKSIPPPHGSFQPYTVTIRRADAVLDFTFKQRTSDGKLFKFSYSAQADGEKRNLGNGLVGAMTRLPSGNYGAELWFSDGSYEHKYCQLNAADELICYATVKQADGDAVLFKQVLERVD